MNFLQIAAIFTFLAGISHAIIQGYSHAGMPFYLISFVLIGITQMAFSTLLYKKKSVALMTLGIIFINITALTFWLLTRTIVAPFVGGVEHFSVIGIVVGIIQLGAIILLLTQCNTKKIMTLLGGIIFGIVSHAGAMQLETLMPMLKGTGGHHAVHQKSVNHDMKNMNHHMQDMSHDISKNAKMKHNESVSPFNNDHHDDGDSH